MAAKKRPAINPKYTQGPSSPAPKMVMKPGAKTACQMGRCK